jgi:hypothetical protein
VVREVEEVAWKKSIYMTIAYVMSSGRQASSHAASLMSS